MTCVVFHGLDLGVPARRGVPRTWTRTLVAWRMVEAVTTPIQSPASATPNGASPHRDTPVVVRRRQPKTFTMDGDRTDPFYEIPWTFGGRAAWLCEGDRSTWLRKRGADLSRREAMNRILTSGRRRDPYGFPVHLAALGVLHSWHTCTAEQLAAFVGDERLAASNAGPLTVGVAAGLYDIGLLQRVGSDSVLGHAPIAVHQLTDDVRRRGAFLDKLAWMQWLAVTGGQGIGVGPRTDRHNILAAELGLRAADLDAVSAVLGERLSRHGQLANDRATLSAHAGARAADLTVVRRDGLRILFEVTSNTSRGFRSKVRASVRLIGDSPLDEWGPVVIFVLAVPPRGERWQKRRRRLRKVVERELRMAVKDVPGTSFDRTVARIAVVDWTEWFPAPRIATAAFRTLVAHRWAPRRESWERVAFGDPKSFPFEPTDPIVGLQIVDNAKLLGQSPWALRGDVDVNGLTRTLLGRYGLGGGTDHPGLGAGRGATGDVQLPQPLLGLVSPRPHPSPRCAPRAPAAPPSASPLDADRERPATLLRAACAIRVVHGEVSVDDVIEYAVRHPDSPIGTLGLAELLRSQPDPGDVRGSLRQMRRAAHVLGEESSITGRTVRWLVDGRSRGRRLAAWRDAGLPRDADPGFPWRQGPFLT